MSDLEAPSGSLFLGPFGAWTVMKDAERRWGVTKKELKDDLEATLLDRNELLAHYQRVTAENLRLKAELAAARIAKGVYSEHLEKCREILGGNCANVADEVAALKSELASAREDTARRCAEIADDETRNKVCLTCGLLVMSAIHREFGIDAARKGGAE